jgi:hypothetical protein
MTMNKQTFTEESATRQQDVDVVDPDGELLRRFGPVNTYTVHDGELIRGPLTVRNVADPPVPKVVEPVVEPKTEKSSGEKVRTFFEWPKKSSKKVDSDVK